MRLTKPLVALAAIAAVGAASQAADALPIGVPSANPQVGTPPNVIVSTHQLDGVAQGSDPLENPSGLITNYGHLSDGTLTEPDQNTYAVFPDGLGGPTQGYDYGTHFLFQGHENGGNLAYITRINLDVSDPTHRISLLTPVGNDGFTHLNSVDGSVYDPFTHTMLFTEEAGSSGGVIEIGPDGSNQRTLFGQIGQGGYEGIRPDNQGRLMLDEDSGGVSVNVDPNDPNSPKAAKQPNSFLFRFTPKDRTDLSAGGKLEALQVSIGGNPVTFHANDPVGDTFSNAQLLLNTPGLSWPVRWVTVHDTATDGSAPFSANALAKAAGATPFKRPENGGFQPATGFRTYLFDATGDTNSDSGNVPALAARGAWGTIFRVHLNAAATRGRISVVALGDSTHNSFDTFSFTQKNEFLVGEDRGDGLHAQLNTLDSVWLYKLGDPNAERFIALGRDPVSLAHGEDNEPTGVNVTNGSTDPSTMFGTIDSLVNAKAFFTQQHGENHTFQIVRNFTNSQKR